MAASAGGLAAAGSVLDPKLRNVAATARGAVPQRGVRLGCCSSWKHGAAQVTRRSAGSSFTHALPALCVRAAAQKQKKENTETSKMSAPPLPKGGLAAPQGAEEEAQTSGQDGVAIEGGSVVVDGSAAVEEGAGAATTVAALEAESVPAEKQMSQEEIGQALKTLRSERVAQGLDNPASTQDFWGGVLEETKLVEWPEFRKVLGTTGVVVAIIFGSSILLLTVNAILAELSDNVFSNGEFAKAWTRGF